MTQTSNRFYDQFARLMHDAAGVAQGVRREASSLFRSQAERFVTDMDLVRREDFDTLREMTILAREENARLAARIERLEEELRSVTAKSLAGGRPAAGEVAGPQAAAKAKGSARSAKTPAAGDSI